MLEGSAPPSRVAAYCETIRHAANVAQEDPSRRLLDDIVVAVLKDVGNSPDPNDCWEDAWLALAHFFDSQDRLQAVSLYTTKLSGVETADQRLVRKQLAARSGPEGRVDLGTHFFAAAALSARFGPKHARTLGLAKERQDGEKYDEDIGTGFSFADLCANEAGIEFAQHMKTHFAAVVAANQIDLRDYIPTVDGLDEGLRWSEVEEQYGGSQGHRFQSRLRRIRERVLGCEAYRRSP